MNTKICFLAVMTWVAAVSAQDNYAQWPNYKYIALTTTATGANVASSQVNFPVLVRLNSANADVFAGSVGRGADIRFSKVDGTHLKYQIERWDSAGLAASIWVLVDTIPGNNTSQIKMLWGKTAAGDSSNGAAVFSTANGFQAVWHFNEGTGATALDATGNHLNATPRDTLSAGMPVDAGGAIGRGKQFNGTSTGNNTGGGYYTVTNSAASALNFGTDGNYTVSAWVTTNALNTVWHTIVSKSDKQYALQIYGSDNSWEFFEYNGGWQAIRSPATATDWTHLVGVRDGVNEYLYANGVLVGSTITLTSNSAARITNTDVRIGARGDWTTGANGNRFWNGLIDEVNMSSVSRSADWTKLTYENQKAGQTLVLLGPTNSPLVKIRAMKAADGRVMLRIVGMAPLAFPLTLAGAEGLKVDIFDMRGRPVWNSVVSFGGQNVVPEMAWDGKSANAGSLGAGVYLVRVTALGSKQRPIGAAERKFIYSP